MTIVTIIVRIMRICIIIVTMGKRSRRIATS